MTIPSFYQKHLDPLNSYSVRILKRRNESVQIQTRAESYKFSFWECSLFPLILGTCNYVIIYVLFTIVVIYKINDTSFSLCPSIRNRVSKFLNRRTSAFSLFRPQAWHVFLKFQKMKNNSILCIIIYSISVQELIFLLVCSMTRPNPQPGLFNLLTGHLYLAPFVPGGAESCLSPTVGSALGRHLVGVLRIQTERSRPVKGTAAYDWSLIKWLTSDSFSLQEHQVGVWKPRVLSILGCAIISPSDLGQWRWLSGLRFSKLNTERVWTLQHTWHSFLIWYHQSETKKYLSPDI